MASYSILDDTGTLQNLIAWDGSSAMPLPAGWTVRLATPSDVLPISPLALNAASYQTAAVQAIGNLEGADTNWATLTAAQKDAAARLCCRVLARLIRLVLNQLS